MAQTIWFPDGTHEVLFNDAYNQFARILRERLGDDMERAFLNLTETMRKEIEGYETCDLQEELDEALADARKLNLELQELKQEHEDLITKHAATERDRARIVAEARRLGREAVNLVRDPGVGTMSLLRRIAEDLALIREGDGGTGQDGEGGKTE